MGVLTNLGTIYKNGNSIIRLIYLNAVVYLALQLVYIVLMLFKQSNGVILPWLALPAEPSEILTRPWTLISYMFLHEQFFHILFNMISLFWFGKIFLYEYSERQFVGLYVMGGLAGAAMYIAFYNIFPLFYDVKEHSLLLGASGAVMALIAASAMRFPNMELRFLLIGNVKLKYIAIVSVLISVFGITGNNAGGEIAHLGGALFGYFFVVSLHKGRDLTKWINGLIDFLHDLFVKPRAKSYKKSAKSSGTRMTDAEFNMNKAQNMREIDRILDKIKKSGYESLNDDEKRKLFEQKR